MIQLVVGLVCVLVAAPMAASRQPLHDLRELVQKETLRSKQNPRSFWSQVVAEIARDLKDEALLVPGRAEWAQEYNDLLEQLAELPRAPLIGCLPLGKVGVRPLLSHSQLRALRLPNLRKDRERSLRFRQDSGLTEQSE